MIPDSAIPLKEFVAKASNSDCHIDISTSRNRVVDAKSILGVLGLDLSGVLTVSVHGYDREFEKYIKNSDAKYLLKYDRVKLVKGFWRKEYKIYSINTLQQDFSGMPQAFAAYIQLRSYQRKQARISARINKSKKYYSRPTELFARFVEGMFIDRERICEIAPNTAKIFDELLQNGYYKELKEVINYPLP